MMDINWTLGTKACTYHNLISGLCIYEGICVYMYGYMHFMLRKSWILMSLFDIIRFHCLALLNLELIKNSFPPPPPQQWISRHGYGRWQAIVDDKDLKVQEVICQELNLPFINLPVPGASSQAPNGANSANPEALQMQGNSTGNDSAAAGVQGTTDAANQAQVYQDSSVLYHFRDMQRRQVEFIKKRVLLLEKGLNAEYQKEYFVSQSNLEKPLFH